MMRGILVAVVSAALCLGWMANASATVVGWGGRDVTFTPPALNGPVRTIIQLKVGANAGKYLIGGSFTDAGGNPAIDYVARLNADGTIDTGFTPPALADGRTTISCYENDDSAAPLRQVRALLENQTTSGSNTAGTIYIGGNFRDAGGNSRQDFLIRVSANGTLDTGFWPTPTGTNAGTPTYANCVHTMFTGEGSGSSRALIVGVDNYDEGGPAVSKKVFDTGANYAGFTAPTMNDTVTTGFYCPSSLDGCGANRYVLGGRFNAVSGNTKMARLVRLNTDGTVDTSAYPTTTGTSDGSILFDSYVNSIALTSSGGSIVVGGKFTGRMAKVEVPDFAPNADFVAPTLNGDIYSVAVDYSTTWYLIGGAFTDADGFLPCDYVCTTRSDGTVVNVEGRSRFAPPPPTDEVSAVAVNDYADANEGKYMIGGKFTDLGGNTGTDYVARLNQSDPASVTLNGDGGNDPGGADGIATLYSNGQFQVYREGTGQLYEPTNIPPNYLMYNQVALSLTAPGGSYAVGPSSLNLNNQNIDFAGGYLYRPWDSVTATGGSATGSGTAGSDLTVEVDGLTYVVHMELEYTFPNNYLTQTFTVDIPVGNTYNVKLYNLYDSYLGGSDFGPGFYNPADRIVGVSGASVIEGLRYAGGQAWAGYMSANYYDVVFGNTEVAAAPTGPGFGANLDNSIVDDPTNDNGFGVNWDFGTAAGTTAPVATDFLFFASQPPTAAPTAAAGEIKVDWTDPTGLGTSPDNYVVTAYDGATPTANTCAVAAPATTCTIAGLDPAIAYSFLVEYRSGATTLFNAASNEVHAKREVTMHIWGDPTSVGPAVTFTRTLGADPDAYMAGYTGLTTANQAVPVATPECPLGGAITSVEAAPGGQPGEYTATVGCEDGLEDINSYSVRINVGAGSCLVAAGLPTGAGTYTVGTSQQSIPTYGTNLPGGLGIPAYQAIKDATPAQAFAATDDAGVYLPATRTCQPSLSPSTPSTTTVGGAIPLDVTTPMSNGGSAVFAQADVGSINGYNRVLAKPSDATGTGGGFRGSYFRCGVTNTSPTDVDCLLSSVRVTTGGSGGLWNPAQCTGQTINFRSRYMTQMGYGLWSDEGSKVLSGACS